MSWARLDDNFHDHPKVQQCSVAAIGLWTLCFTWAHRHMGASGMPLGFIPRTLPRHFCGQKSTQLVQKLVSSGLWNETEDGWIIHDFEDYLPASKRPSTSDDVREARREAGRRGAQSRWQNDGKPDGKLPEREMPPSRPVPTQLPTTYGSRASSQEIDTSGSFNQRVNSIAQVAVNNSPPRGKAVPFNAVRQAVAKVLGTGNFTDQHVYECVQRLLSEEGRTITQQTLLIECEGGFKTQSKASTTDDRVRQALIAAQSFEEINHSAYELES